MIFSRSRRQLFAAAMISLKTMSRAVSSDGAPFMRTVRCRTVAKALSIGFDVRRCVQRSAGKSKNVNSASRSLSRQSTALSYLGAYFSAQIVIAASAARDIQYGHKLNPTAGGSGLILDLVIEAERFLPTLKRHIAFYGEALETARQAGRPFDYWDFHLGVANNYWKHFTCPSPGR